METRKIRMLIAKPGFDGHDRGVTIVAQILRDAGIEVIYLGREVLPEQIVAAAIQEDIDIIGLNMISVDAVYLFSEVQRLLKEHNAKHITLCGGGIIPKEDGLKLKEMGVKAFFGPGTRSQSIIDFVRSQSRTPKDKETR